MGARLGFWCDQSDVGSSGAGIEMKGKCFALIEYVTVLAVLLVIATFVLRIVYGAEIREWELSFGPEKYFVIGPLYLLVLYSYWQRSAKEAKELGQPVVRPWV